MKDAMISQEYRDNIEALAADPIVQAMENAVPKDIDLEAWNSGGAGAHLAERVRPPSRA